MKHFFTTAAAGICGFVLLAGTLCAADFKTSMADGAKAVKAKDLKTAEASYDAALKEAKTSSEKRMVYLAKYDAYCKFSKWSESDQWIKTARKDTTLASADRRIMLNEFARSFYWGSRWKFSLELLKEAEGCKASQYNNEYYITYEIKAGILLNRANDPKGCIETLKPVLDLAGVHPANEYNAYRLSGQAYEKLGDKAKALECYKKGLAYGKKVKYKFSYSPMEKDIERLSK